MSFVKIDIMRNILALLILSSSLFLQAQTETDRLDLQGFNKLVVSPRIDLHLIQGANESVELEFYDIDKSELVVDQSNKRLSLYLKDARSIEKTNKYKNKGHKYREGVYEGGKVIAFVTYSSLRKLVIKGEQIVTVEGSLFSDRLRLKMYGEPEVRFDELYAEKLHATAYGECDLTIRGGHAEKQKYVLYGESEVDAENMKTENCKVTSFGENSLSMDTDDLYVTGFGELEIKHIGRLRPRGFVIGEKDYRRID